MNARGKIPESLRSLLRSELEKAIYEAALHRDDDLIARRYMIDKWAQADIAAVGTVHHIAAHPTYF